MRSAETLVTFPFLLASWLFALATVISSDIALFAGLLSGVLLMVGIAGVVWRDEAYFTVSMGGQMAWSVVALGLTGASVLLLWAYFFGHMLILLAGARGMWIRRMRLFEGPEDALPYGPMLRDLLIAYVWLGSSAALSFAFIVLAPYLRFDGGGFVLVALLAFVTIIGFALMARRVLGKKD